MMTVRRKLLWVCVAFFSGCGIVACSTVWGFDDLTGSEADAGNADSGLDMAVADASSDGAGPSDSGTDAKPPDTGAKDVAVDAPCAVSCPTGTTCNSGTFCDIPQGPACAGVSFNGSSGAVDGTVCTASAGPKVQTTCPNAIDAPATFINFSSGGGPWNVIITATSGPIQVQLMNASCSTPGACTALASGASTTIVANQGSVVAIVSVSGCSDWEATYVSK